MLQDQIMWEVETGSKHELKQFCRDICVSYFLHQLVPNGVEDQVVEIDESLFARINYYCGRIVKEQWIFGSMTIDKKGVLVPVPAREAGPLLSVVQQWVMPGSKAHSDMWQAYTQLGTLGYKNETLNHSLLCGPCHSGSHQPCLAMWQRTKNKFKSQYVPMNWLLISVSSRMYVVLKTQRDHFLPLLAPNWNGLVYSVR